MATRERCPKCGGSMYHREDLYSEYLSCLMCGATREITALGSLDELLEAVLRPQRARLGLSEARSTAR